MNAFIIQTVLPFFLSAFIVVLITVIAERYGTKTGGILGTLPSTIVIAFIFISINKDVTFASRSAAVVPAELGINLLFLFFFAVFAYRSTFLALAASMSIWAILSSLLYFFSLENIFISLAVYFLSLILTFTLLEKVKKVESKGKVKVHYTPLKIAYRGLLAGTIIAIAVFLSNLNSVLSGIFSVFPAILSSTMIISIREHGPDFTAGMAKSMIFGISSVMVYATSIHLLYPIFGLIMGTVYAYIISFLTTIFLFKIRRKIR